MDAGAALRVTASVLLTVVLTSGCAQDWERVAAALGLRGSEAPPVAERDIAAISGFETAAGIAPADDPAAQHLERLGDEVLAAMLEPVAREERIARFEAILGREVDIALVARFVIGGHWQTAGAAQRTTFLQAFGDYLVRTYAFRLGGVQVRTFEVLETRKLSTNDVLVRSRIVQDAGGAIRADWRFSLRDGRFRIVDLSVDGVSMALTMRQEFASVLRRQGGVDGLTALLRERTVRGVDDSDRRAEPAA